MRPNLDSDPLITMTLFNEVTAGASIQLSVPATLQVQLLNNTGEDLKLTSGSAPAQLQIFMPDGYFSSDQVQAMTITLANWTCVFLPASVSLQLSHTGPDEEWKQGVALLFNIEDVLCTGDIGSGQLFINPANIDGDNVPIQIPATLTIVDRPSGKKPNLFDVLQVTVENQGIVYVSTEKDPLKNQIVVNFKNVGTTPIYTGQNPWTLQPQIKARFDYGSNPGDLAPAIDPSKPPVGSAWNIKGILEAKQGGDWGIDGPGSDTTPAWAMAPANTNVEVLGVGNTSNVTFGFTEIVSITQPGHTQLHLDFSNFYRDENTQYDQSNFPPLDILKLNAPPTRGLLSLISRNGVLFQTKGPSDNIVVSLAWKMLYVAQVTILSSYPGMAAITRKYPNAAALNSDVYSLIIPGSWNSMPVFITIQAYDAQGGYLNSMQLSVSITSNNFVDPRDGAVYPTVQIGNKYWLAHNLNYNDPNEWCDYYNNNSANGPRYGRLYSGDVALETPPDGWRLPRKSDWDSLIATYGITAYAALIDGGSSGFNAQLGGTFQSDSGGGGGSYVGLTQKGYYWTSTLVSGQLSYALFTSSSGTISTRNVTTLKDGCSIRYVKDI